MPITAKLSRKFYETLGDEIANELVDWFNQVDATYRGELRELNDLNYARFEAKLEQRVAELRREILAGLAALRGEIAGLRAEMAGHRSELIKWMFFFWAGSTATMVGLAFTVARFLKP